MEFVYNLPIVFWCITNYSGVLERHFGQYIYGDIGKVRNLDANHPMILYFGRSKWGRQFWGKVLHYITTYLNKYMYNIREEYA